MSTSAVLHRDIALQAIFDAPQVKSVSDVQAAKLLGCQPKVEILSVEADEAHVKAAKSTVKQGRSILPQLPYSA